MRVINPTTTTNSYITNTANTTNTGAINASNTTNVKVATNACDHLVTNNSYKYYNYVLIYDYE